MVFKDFISGETDCACQTGFKMITAAADSQILNIVKNCFFCLFSQEVFVLVACQNGPEVNKKQF
jgi:hypothetical protein